MELHNIILVRGDVVKTNTKNYEDDEATFIGVLPNNTVYLAWDMYFCKKLFVEEENIHFIKKVDANNKVFKIWECTSGNKDFILIKDVV